MTLKRVIVSLLLPFSINMSAQYTKTASCSNVDFDKKVNSYLNYSAPVINVKDAYNHKSKYIFLDAREFEEYQTSHIPEARFIGYEDFKIEKIKDLSKESNIIVYCSIGYRSEKIATKLKKAGYKNVYNLYGSIFEWVNSGFDTADKNGKSTNKIHTYNKSWSKWVSHQHAEKVW
jgi:rhodanese-related sulfurtransferase